MMPGPSGPGVIFHKGDNTRLAGKMQLHERLRFDPEGRPGLYVFSTCEDWLRTVPTLPYSTTKKEDVDSDAEDHAYDETRYFLQDHPVVAKGKPKPMKPRPFDPFREG
jgi:hypothetical protein